MSNEINQFNFYLYNYLDISLENNINNINNDSESDNEMDIK